MATETLDTLRPVTAGMPVVLNVKCEAAAPLSKAMPASSTSSVAPCRAPQPRGEGFEDAISATLPTTLWFAWLVSTAWLGVTEPNPEPYHDAPLIELAGMAMPSASKSSPVTV